MKRNKIATRIAAKIAAVIIKSSIIELSKYKKKKRKRGERNNDRKRNKTDIMSLA